ncbi:MAG: hypothetical protein UZ11_BCD004000087 [Bacteroidetes bacterium OLB11]|nr:MAG: hypothetical protein UZ11_BCD004000087 [Bacteroidetes bacterium OLB11]
MWFQNGEKASCIIGFEQWKSIGSSIHFTKTKSIILDIT